MRNKIIAGNWKMHKTNPEAVQLANQIKIRVTDIKNTEIVLCPPFTSLNSVSEVIKDSKIKLGAQNVFWETQGAFTGEISPEMLKALNVTYAIIGHSERRQYFGETDQTVNKRIKAALASGLKVIFCFGETLEERESGKTMKLVENQVKGGLSEITEEQMKSIVLAYEPVWAIGTGKTATPNQAQEVHKFVRETIATLFNSQVANQVRIQYGGSVKAENADELLSQPDIDGALVGGACLKAETFVPIIQSGEKL